MVLRAILAGCPICLAGRAQLSACGFHPLVPRASSSLHGGSHVRRTSSTTGHDGGSDLVRHVATLSAELKATRAALRRLAARLPLEFSVAQFNILASYLGNNTEPWFLYGADGLDDPSHGPTRRQSILAKFYERDAKTRELCNKGWPNYVEGILSPAEVAAVEARDTAHFNWEARAPKLLASAIAEDADILSLVELDRFDDVWAPGLANAGYAGVHKKRPRDSSADGCALFWRYEVFELVAADAIDFVDRIDQTTGEAMKDRCAVLALLRSRDRPEQCVVAISIHLARNPEDAQQDALRARQVAQVLRALDDFTHKHHGTLASTDARTAKQHLTITPNCRPPMLDAPPVNAIDAPVILCGDLNATNFSKLRGVVLALSALTAVDGARSPHPFIWDAMDVPSRATSVTTARNVRIDCIFHEPSRLALVDGPRFKELDGPIPDSANASDHVPVRAAFRLRSRFERDLSVARAYFFGVAELFADAAPLMPAELDTAWVYFSWDSSSQLTLPKLRRAVALMGVQVTAEIEEAVFHRMGHGADVVGFEEFRAAYEAALRTRRAEAVPELIEAFSAFDVNGDGHISFDELFTSLERCSPVAVSRNECELIFRDIDSDESGMVSYAEFANRIIDGRLLAPLIADP